MNHLRVSRRNCTSRTWTEIRAEIGGSSYVIAQLDDAYTDYWEINLEAEWRGDNYWVGGSYVYSDYSGNFDQDNTTVGNDGNIFIGSSNIADGAGRQLWDNKDGTLRGDRPHQFKMYGYYDLKWNAGIGAYFVYQSGQPWEAWDVEVYRAPDRQYQRYHTLRGACGFTADQFARPAGFELHAELLPGWS